MAGTFATLFPRGFRLINGQTLNNLFGGPYIGRSYENSITATAGGAKAGSYVLQASWNRVTTVANAADSLRLPANPSPGTEVVLINDAAANSLQLFGSNNDTIDDVATAIGVAQAAAKRVIYRVLSVSSTGVAAWYSMAGAKTS